MKTLSCRLLRLYISKNPNFYSYSKPTSHSLYKNPNLFQNPSFFNSSSIPTNYFLYKNPNFIQNPRFYSTEKPISETVSIFINNFENFEKVDHDLIVNALKELGEDPKTAKKLFGWVTEKKPELLSSKSYNFICGILGSNLCVNEFWEMLNLMKIKGFGLKKGTYNRVYEQFEKNGLLMDLEKLKKIYDVENDDLSEKVDFRVFNLVKKNVWSDEVEKKLKLFGEKIDKKVILSVLEKLVFDTNKGLIFFRFVEENEIFKHDEDSYNVMAMVLSNEKFVDKFWNIVFEMRGKGFDLKKSNFIEVFSTFIENKMIKDAVNLYEFSMLGDDKAKPSVQDCVLLLRKIVAYKELDMDLFRKALKAFSLSGNELTNPILDSVVKSLVSVGRVSEVTTILKAFGKVGFLPGEGLTKKIAFILGHKGKREEASEFMSFLESSGLKTNSKTWGALVEGYLACGDINEAKKAFKTMVEKEGASVANYALNMLVTYYCRENRALDAYKLVYEELNELVPWHTTYKLLISKLLYQGGFAESLDLLCLMKTHGFPPFVEPLIEYVSKKGTSEEAITFLTATTVKPAPPVSAFIRVFEGFLKAERHDEAHDLLSKCPKFVREHADILNLFFEMKADIEPDMAVAA